MFEPFITENIIVGNAELFALPIDGITHWVLPGGRLTNDKDEAIKLATTINNIINRYSVKYKRKFRTHDKDSIKWKILAV